jgi:DNA helicase-2/ATP-dependent DNA helicase PcrA
MDVFASPALLTEAGLAAAAQKKCQALVAELDTLAEKIGRPQRSSQAQAGLFAASSPLGAKDALALAVQTSGVADRLEAEGGLEAEGRLENLAELVNAAATFEELARRNGEAGDIEAFLESAALLGSADDNPADEGRGRVTLMTLHAAKGLEFDVVFLVGLEEHGFPHSRAVLDDDDGAIEEERRLAYVGITRARKRLVLSYAARRMVQGVTKMRDPSRFLFEIPRALLEGDVPRRAGDRGAERGSLLDEWRTRHLGRRPAPARDDDDDGGGVRVVYDDDAVAVPRAPRVPRTQLVAPPRDDTGDDGDDSGGSGDGASAGAATRTSVVVRDDDPAVGIGGFGGAARRFRLGVAATAKATSSPSPGSSSSPSRVVVDGDGEGGAFATGDRVAHRLFGEGTIVGQRGSGRALNCLVRFDSERAPRLIAARHLTSPSPSREEPST